MTFGQQATCTVAPRRSRNAARWLVVLCLLCAAAVVPADVAAQAGSPVSSLASWRRRLASQYQLTDLGCAADGSAASLASFFADALGPIVGHDSPRVISVGNGLNVWLLQDTFVDYTGRFHTLDRTYYSNNTLVIEYKLCFTMVRNTASQVDSTFEEGVGPVTFGHYYWPLGGMVVGNELRIFWSEMVRDKTQSRVVHGIDLHPVATWLATYDLQTLRKIAFVPAPNPGVSPIYGFAVESQGAWTYLFGNTFQQNLSLEGGLDNTPHSMTSMWLARVPLGRLDERPTYWTGSSWSSRASHARPYLQRNKVENAMIPVYLDGRWFSATKVDGFVGNRITVDTAPRPWGPWTTFYAQPSWPRGDPAATVTYHALVLPWLDPSGGLIVSLSQVPPHLETKEAPALYRPNFFLVRTPPAPRPSDVRTGRRLTA
jgi:hypothetical protein